MIFLYSYIRFIKAIGLILSRWPLIFNSLWSQAQQHRSIRYQKTWPSGHLAIFQKKPVLVFVKEQSLDALKGPGHSYAWWFTISTHIENAFRFEMGSAPPQQQHDELHVGRTAKSGACADVRLKTHLDKAFSSPACCQCSAWDPVTRLD